MVRGYRRGIKGLLFVVLSVKVSVFRVACSVFSVEGIGVGVQRLVFSWVFSVQCLGFRVEGSGWRVQCVGFRV